MNPTPGQVTSIKQFVLQLSGGWSNTDAQIRAAMASTAVANPIASAPTVARPYTAAGLLGMLSQSSIANLYSFPAIHDLFDDITAQHTANVAAAASLLAAAGKVTGSEAQAVAAALTATQADPAWAATLPWDVANLGRVADDFDIESARHG